MTGIDDLIEGYREFYQQYFTEDTALYRTLSTVGQSPKTLVIACSDSRADPSIILNAEPGDLFVIRNVANLVPPHEPETPGLHGVSAALEFAVRHVKVEHIVVLGHSDCAGIKALLTLPDFEAKGDSPFHFVHRWVQMARQARDEAFADAPEDETLRQHCCAQHGIIHSLENLMTFPWVEERVKDGKLSLHGWYFSVADGKLHYADPEGEFHAVKTT